jgi:hypothetical protein
MSLSWMLHNDYDEKFYVRCILPQLKVVRTLEKLPCGNADGRCHSRSELERQDLLPPGRQPYNLPCSSSCPEEEKTQWVHTNKARGPQHRSASSTRSQCSVPPSSGGCEGS